MTRLVRADPSGETWERPCGHLARVARDPLADRAALMQAREATQRDLSGACPDCRTIGDDRRYAGQYVHAAGYAE